MYNDEFLMSNQIPMTNEKQMSVVQIRCFKEIRHFGIGY